MDLVTVPEEHEEQKKVIWIGLLPFHTLGDQQDEIHHPGYLRNQSNSGYKLFINLRPSQNDSFSSFLLFSSPLLFLLF